MKEKHGFGVTYTRFHNEIQKSDVLMIWVYYRGKFVECLSFANGERLSI